MRMVVGIRLSRKAKSASRGENEPRPTVWFDSWRTASNLSRTLRTLEGYGLVKLHRRPESRAIRLEALATEFLVVLD